MNDQQFVHLLQALLGHLRACNLWFHGAHHVTVGTGFHGDHKFYRQVYEQYNNDFDGAAEKAIATSGVSIAAPQAISARAVQIMSTFPAIAGLNGQQIATAALQIERQTIIFVEQAFRNLENGKRLSLGMNDFLAALANAHETNIYKLTQRTSGGQG